MRREAHSAWLAVVAATLSVGGCILVTPLEDQPEASAGKDSGGKPSSAGSNQGGTDGGEMPLGGEGGAGAQSMGGKKPTDGPCETNAECVARYSEQPARCRPSDHQCVPLTSDVCPLAYGTATDPNAIFIGAFTTLDQANPEENSIAWAHRLALEELSGNLNGGLPDGPGGQRRPLVMTLCSNRTEDVDAAMAYLAEQIQVPAIIATLRPGDLRRAYDDYAARKILYLSPVTVTQTLVDQDKPNLIWNLLGKPADMAPAYGPLLAKTEAFIRGPRALPKEIPLRVALVSTKDAFDSELGNAIPEHLRFNGKNVIANGPAAYQGYDIVPSETSLTDLAQDIVAFRPHVIISAASELLGSESGLLDAVEFEWGDGPGEAAEIAFRPQWILSPFNAGDLEWLRVAIKGNVESQGLGMEQRFVGISIAGPTDTTLQNAYATRLKKSFRNAFIDTANYYDAFYFLAYGMYASGDSGTPDGPSIANGLKRLVSGTVIDIGAPTISKVFKALGEPEASVELASTLGPGKFDPETGVRPVESSVFCFEPTSENVLVRNDVLRYNPQTKELDGDKFPCFAGFLK